MALEEKRVLRSVNVLYDRAAIDVVWLDQVSRDDGTVIASTPHARAYTAECRAQFIEDLSPYENATAYAELAWGAQETL